jgi:hypothetical protein
MGTDFDTSEDPPGWSSVLGEEGGVVQCRFRSSERSIARARFAKFYTVEQISQHSSST